jgi:hypothetical protein
MKRRAIRLSGLNGMRLGLLGLKNEPHRGLSFCAVVVWALDILKREYKIGENSTRRKTHRVRYKYL